MHELRIWIKRNHEIFSDQSAGRRHDSGNFAGTSCMEKTFSYVEPYICMSGLIPFMSKLEALEEPMTNDNESSTVL